MVPDTTLRMPQQLVMDGETSPAQRRWHLLELLAEEEMPISIDRLGGMLLTHAAFPADRDRIRTILHHVDLPKLTATGALEYDAERHVIERVRDIDRNEPEVL